ncbi:hypothetical protein PIB30_098894, partial [Stylosanthes scabra]|nr:hypothetical protein [Stylosanthes scabra]
FQANHKITPKILELFSVKLEFLKKAFKTKKMETNKVMLGSVMKGKGLVFDKMKRNSER